MSASTLDTLIWVLIYGGLIVLGLGLSVQRSDAALGWSFVAVGTAVTAVGVVLVVVRARMKSPGQP